MCAVNTGEKYLAKKKLPIFVVGKKAIAHSRVLLVNRRSSSSV